uniref:Cytochrome P450 94A1 n=1 Tax=Ananas comosus var. bracteatus TaxID=296719 RepID=A0A6V7PHX6_ANACO|nr:unnamed protein product [Ananas comosus var. bracteatus]
MEMITSLSSLIFALPFIALLSIFFLRRNHPPSNPPALSVLRGYPVVGNLPSFVRNHRRMVEWTSELLLASPTGTVSVAPLVLTADPAAVEHVAKSSFHNYPKIPSFVSAFHDFLGTGILNSDGDPWRVQRRTAELEFGTRPLRSSVLEIVNSEIACHLFPLLQFKDRKQELFDFQNVLGRFAFDVICRVVFGEDVRVLGEEKSELFYRAFDGAAAVSIDRSKQHFSALWKLKEWLDGASAKQLRESVRILHESIDRLLQSRKAKSNDFLSRFVDDETLSAAHVRDVLINFVIAGRDTVPTALTWFFWALSSRPDVVEKIRDEIRSVRSSNANDDDEEGGGDKAFGLDELREMNYLHAAITETLRLHPPVPLTPRVSAAEDELPDGTRVGKGWMVIYNAHAMGRSERVWGPDCREFRPERWLDGAGGGRFRPASPFKYTAFHAGPRMCLGKEVAYVQMKAVAASVIEGFDVEVAEERGRFVLGMTMKMEGGLPVRVRERNPAAKIV